MTGEIHNENFAGESHPRALIVGAGVSGLTAALHLANLRPWWKITVIDQADHVGGLAATWDVAGWRIDLGPHRWNTELVEIGGFCKSVFDENMLVKVKRHSKMLVQGKIIAYPPEPLNLIKKLGFFKTVYLGLSAVWSRLVMQYPQQTLTGVMKKAYGKAVCDLIIFPYSEKVWKTPSDALSPEIARVRLSRTKSLTPDAKSEIYYFHGGNDRLVLSLKERCEQRGIRILTGMKIRSLNCHEDRTRITEVEVQDQTTGENNTSEVDCIISTMPITTLSDLLSQISPNKDAEVAAAALQYLGMILVAVEINKPRYSRNTWIYFSDRELIFNRMFEPINFDESLGRPDKGVIVFDITSKTDQEPWLWNNETIIDTVYKQLIDNHILRKQDVLTMYLLRVPQAYPLYAYGFEANLEVLMKQCAMMNNIVTTGRQGLFNHNNMDHSILMGLRAAECIADGGDVGMNWSQKYYPTFRNFRIID